MNDQQQAALLQFFKAVGQPERATILGMLARRPYSIPELAGELNLSETVVSNQIRKLSNAGLVHEDSRAFTHTYQLDSNSLAELNRVILGDGQAGNPVEETIAQFIDGQAIRRIPENAGQRQIILNWLIEEFEVNHRYTEEEVDAIIGRHYPRQLTLRRYLVDSRLLKRTGGIYWRPEAG